jgi:hypothetical protein
LKFRAGVVQDSLLSACDRIALRDVRERKSGGVELAEASWRRQFVEVVRDAPAM